MVLFTSGCGKHQVRLTLEGSKVLNLNESGGPLPVVVRIYELEKKDRFENADFMTLWKNDKEILEKDLLERNEVTLFPGTSMTLDVKFSKQTEFVAVMALFRKPQGNTWREILPVKPPKSSKMRIIVQERSLKLDVK